MGWCGVAQCNSELNNASGLLTAPKGTDDLGLGAQDVLPGGELVHPPEWRRHHGRSWAQQAVSPHEHCLSPQPPTGAESDGYWARRSPLMQLLRSSVGRARPLLLLLLLHPLLLRRPPLEPLQLRPRPGMYCCLRNPVVVPRGPALPSWLTESRPSRSNGSGGCRGSRRGDCRADDSEPDRGPTYETWSDLNACQPRSLATACLASFSPHRTSQGRLDGTRGPESANDEAM